jgi:hypothetical protein
MLPADLAARLEAAGLPTDLEGMLEAAGARGIKALRPQPRGYRGPHAWIVDGTEGVTGAVGANPIEAVAVFVLTAEGAWPPAEKEEQHD